MQSPTGDAANLVPSSDHKTEDSNPLHPAARSGSGSRLFRCPDCAGSISSEAPACPHCGRPIKINQWASHRVVALLVILTLLVGWQVLKPYPKWEYKIESVSDYSFSISIDNLGRDGWELVTARRATSSATPGSTEKPEVSYEMIFKRAAR